MIALVVTLFIRYSNTHERRLSAAKCRSPTPSDELLYHVLVLPLHISIDSMASMALGSARTQFGPLALPPELVCAVIDSASLEDLPALRLTCRHFKTLSIKRFSSEKFGNRTVCGSIQSLDAFVEITAHPMFGPARHTLGIASHCHALISLREVEEDREGTLTTLDLVRAMDREQESFEKVGT